MDLLVGRRRLEVIQGMDVSAHAPYSSSLRGPATPGRRAARPNRPRTRTHEGASQVRADQLVDGEFEVGVGAHVTRGRRQPAEWRETFRVPAASPCRGSGQACRDAPAAARTATTRSRRRRRSICPHETGSSSRSGNCAVSPMCAAVRAGFPSRTRLGSPGRPWWGSAGRRSRGSHRPRRRPLRSSNGRSRALPKAAASQPRSAGRNRDFEGGLGVAGSGLTSIGTNDTPQSCIEKEAGGGPGMPDVKRA